MRSLLVPRGRASAAAALAILTAGSAGWQNHLAAQADDPFRGLDQLERKALQDAVLERNQGIAAARAALEAAAARIDSAAGLPELSLRYGLAPRSIGSSAVDAGYQVEAMQMLPARGRRGLRRDVATAEAESAAQELATLRLELTAEASQRYDDYYVLRRAWEITAEHVALLEDLFHAVTGRYAAGLASQQDPLQAEVELAHLQHDQVVLQSDAEVIRAEINALLHRDAAAALPPPPDELPLPPGEVLDLALDEARLLEQALAARPELRAAAAAIRAREAELGLARLGGRPDLGVSAGYSSMWNEAEHRVMFGGALSWPVWRKRVRAGIVEAAAGLAEAEALSLARLDETRRDVHVAAARLREAHHLVEIYRSRLLPPARDQVRAARAGFESGRNDFAALIGAARGLRSLELRYHEALAAFYRNRAALERAVGGPVLPIQASRTPVVGVSTRRPSISPEGAEP
jgi:outer membrane protein, heavy metal efflux system